MSVLKKNILANFSGNIWNGLMGLVFVPLYIRFMGIEAYGLIGIFASIIALFALLDMGLSSTLNREIACLVVQKNKAQDMRDLVRTLEVPYWSVGLLIALIVTFSSPLIAYHWVQVNELAPESVRTSVILMGLCVAFQWPIGLYSGGLMGLQRQVLLNGINIAAATIRGFGAVLILSLVSPTLEAYFLWQLAVSAMHLGLATFFLWRCLPSAPRAPRFRRDLLLNIWRFAAGMTGITVLVTILTQLDKIILSRMLTLEMFGYYSLASVVSLNLYRFVTPVFTATYPRLTMLMASGSHRELVNTYHAGAQLVSVLCLPVAVIVGTFSREILLLWTQDVKIANHAHVLVSILIAGTAINGMMNMPYALQLASGWTRLTFYSNLISVIVLVPALVLLSFAYGAAGAASVWVMLNIGYLLLMIPIMHRRLLPTEKWHWYINDVALPLFAACSVAGLLRLTIALPSNPIPLVGLLTMAYLLTLTATALASDVCRQRLLITYKRLRPIFYLA